MLNQCKAGLLAVAFFALSALGTGTAYADIIVVTGVNNQGTDNVLLNPATNVTTVSATNGPGICRLILGHRMRIARVNIPMATSCHRAVGRATKRA